MNLFKKWFAPLDEQNLEIKIKIIGVDQEYNNICKYKCYAYWKLSSGFFWKKSGEIFDSGFGHKVSRLTEKDYDNLLNKARVRVLEILRNDGPIKKDKTIISIPIKELDL